MVAAIEGDKQLQRVLKELKESAAKRAVQKGLTKAAMEGRKLVKAAVPSQYKNIRKAIGWRALSRKRNNNEPGAKVGAGVGRQAKTDTTKRKLAFIRSQNRARKNRTTKGGVGLGAKNIHWWYMGTKGRTTKAGGYRGRMPAMGEPVKKTLSANAGKLAAVIKTNTWIGIQKEVAKLKR